MLANGEAHVWMLEVADDAAITGQDVDVLSHEERAIARRFVRPQHAERYIRAHVGLRRLLGAYTGCHPAGLRFERTPAGKPYLLEGCLHFNLSHSGRCVAVGVSAGSPIGVDVEEIRPSPDCRELARVYFARDEFEWMTSGSEAQQLARFYRLWTIKEALVKATGVGVSALAEALVTDEWHVETCDAVTGYAAAAVVAPGVSVQWRTRSEGTQPWQSFPTSWSVLSSSSMSLPHSCSTTSARRRSAPTPSPSNLESSPR